MPAASIAFAVLLGDACRCARRRAGRVWPFLTLAPGSTRSAAASRPTRRRWNASGSSADSERMIQLPSSVPQSRPRGDDVLRHVHEAPGQVPGVRGAEGGVGEALAGAVGADEVLEDGHALAEVAAHGDVDDPAGGVGHQAAHGAQLADVALVAAGTRVGHHPDGVLLAQGRHHLVRDVLGDALPQLDDLLVALVLGDEAALELLVDRGDVVVRLGHQRRPLDPGPRCPRGRWSGRRGWRT